MTKKIVKLLVIVHMMVLAWMITGCSTTATNTQSDKPSQTKKAITIHYGYQPGHAQIVVARDLGWIEEEFGKDGIKFEFEKFTSGPPMIEAFAGNRLDIGQVGDQPAIQARANNIDLKAIGVYSDGTKSTGLVVTDGSNINSLQDLKGKKVGFVVGSVSHQLLYVYLKHAGLTSKDVQQVNMTPADIVTATKSKDIDAAVIWEPNISVIEAAKAGKLLLDSTGYKQNINVIVARSEFLTQNPEVVTRLLKVLDKAEKWIKANPDQALDIISKDTGFKAEVLKPAFEKNTFDLRLTADAVKSIEETADFLK